MASTSDIATLSALPLGSATADETGAAAVDGGSRWRPGRESLGKADRDVVILGIAFAAILLFVGTGGSGLAQAIDYLQGRGSGPDKPLVTAILLNIALIVFGWRRYVELSGEVEERRKAETAARMLAETDPLTGCLNRRSMSGGASELIERATKHGHQVATFVVDLDGFKLVNDLNGHGAGDAVLTHSVERLRQAIGKNGIVARLGGDEFACMLSYNPAHAEQLDEVAGRIAALIAQPVEHKGLSYEVTASIGIDVTSSECAGLSAADVTERMIHNADIAMYHAKKKGGNRAARFELAMESQLRFRSQMERGIRRGIANREFVPYYEQQIDIETGRLTGFEMLARWRSAELGLVSPEIFIPIAEEMGVIGDLSEQLIAQALADAKDWSPDLILSVNISPIQLQDPWFAQKILRLLTDSGFPPYRLDIEITESCLHENVQQVRAVIASLKNQGIKISLDDFGTGYSSIAQLRSLPFDRLKIDRSFIGELGSEQASPQLVEAIIALAKGLGLPITAEGIENERVLDALKGLGTMKGQGYHYGRPENAEATTNRLREQQLLASQPGQPAPSAPAETRPIKKRKSA